MINAKTVSSPEKIYTDSSLDSFDSLSRISLLRGERLNFQIAYGCDNAEGKKIVDAVRIKPEISGDLAVFYEALEDVKAMKLAESLSSHSEVVRAMEDVFGEEIAFATCAGSSASMLAIRQLVNEIIKKNL